MKIALCYDRTVYLGGGVDRTCLELTKSFLKMNHEVILIYKNGPKSKISRVKSYRIECPDFPIIGSLFFAMKLPEVLDKLCPDLVITQLSFAPLLGKIKQRHLHIIYNLEFLEMINADINRNFLTERPIILICEILNCLRADKVVTINNQLARQISWFYGAKPEVVNLGVDTRKFRPIKKKPNRPPRIICVSREGKRRKNLSLLIQACRGLNLELRLTNSPFKNLSKNMVNLGFISEKQLVEELQNADALILPSKQESFGLAVLEALACNTSVVITKTGIWQKVVKFKAGEIIELSVKGIRNGLRKVLQTDYDNRPRKLAELYSWDETAKSILKIAGSIKKS